MDEWLAKMLTVIYPTLIVCGSALTYAWLRLRHERRMANDRRDEFEHLEQAIEHLRAQHADELALLHERLDFAERMLTQRRIEDARREEPTPV